MTSALSWLNRNKLWGWILFLIYAPLVTFPHDTVQYYVNEIAIRFGHKKLYQGAAVMGVSLAAIFTLVFLLAWRKQPVRKLIGWFWLITMFLIFATWWGFMANNTEIVHFPQYFPEGILLLALTGSAVEAVAWGVFFGGLDECFQYWFVVKRLNVPYDFNDIFMDLLGTAAGVLFAMVFLKLEWREAGNWWKQVLARPGVRVILGIVIAGILLWATGFMVLYEAPDAAPHWFSLSRQTKLPFWFSIGFLGPRTFHELTPIEGPLLNLAGIALYALIDRRVRITAPNA